MKNFSSISDTAFYVTLLLSQFVDATYEDRCRFKLYADQNSGQKSVAKLMYSRHLFSLGSYLKLSFDFEELQQNSVNFWL